MDISERIYCGELYEYYKSIVNYKKKHWQKCDIL